MGKRFYPPKSGSASTGSTTGGTTGANPFFCKRGDEWRDLGLEEYTTPLLKASGQLSRIPFDQELAGEWGMLDLHETVQQALSEVEVAYKDIDDGESVKRWLDESGRSTLLEYINWGEAEGYHERPTTSARNIWFSLGELERPPMLMTDFTWRVHRVVWNAVGAAAVDQFYNVSVSEGVNEELLCGILNSRVTWLMSELRGRKAGGEGLTRSRIKVYEAKQLPVPDPREMSEDERAAIREALDALMDKERELGEEVSVDRTEPERDALDRAVLATMGMENRVPELKEAVSALVAMREREAGAETEVLVDRVRQIDDREVIDLAGVSSSTESATLSDYE